MRILFIGDIVGSIGRTCVKRLLPGLREAHRIDLVLANGENAAGGLGATPAILQDLFSIGIHGITMGNHTWRKRELVEGIDSVGSVVRPANYPGGVPGKGSVIVELPDGRRAGLVNVLGRVYMEPYDNPFEAALREVERLRKEVAVVVVDFHAEATAEKVAMGWYLDGRCTAVVGTHTHVQTADERVLPQGTAYITDLGMTGPFDSVIGLDRKLSIQKFLTGLPVAHTVATERPGLCGAVVEADDATGRALSIERVVRMMD
ncbi:MAG: TIGR00282 family metallophosphoesterase [Candidatus Hydrogenedentes bacterium]|nr:TIGR00282 family metallophosphoesterase [Candidatus Hydrogenedentota bacterium]